MTITLPCKRSGCSGTVTYTEGSVDGVVPTVANGLIASRKTMRVYLGCSNADDPHEYPYDIEVAGEESSNHVFGSVSATKASSNAD